MSDQNQTRRSFIKGSVAKGLIVTNTAALAGLINTPGTVGADTTAPGSTQPASTQPGSTVFTWYLNKQKTNGNSTITTETYLTQQEAQAAAYSLIPGAETDTNPYTGPLYPLQLNPPNYSGGNLMSEPIGGTTYYYVTVAPYQVMIKQVREVPQ